MIEFLKWYLREIAAGLFKKAGGTPEMLEPPAPKPARDRFAECLPVILESEGGWSDDPYDPGGATNMGITIAVWSAWHKKPVSAETRASLKAAKVSDVSPIYKARYWDLSRAGEFPIGLDLFHFDTAVNMGVVTAIKMLQRALGVDDDGEVGPITLGAAQKADTEKVLREYAKLREARYRSLSTFWRFGRGWLNRNNRTLELALKDAPDGPTPNTLPLEHADWLDAAWAMLGTKEIPGKTHNAKVLKLWKDGKVNLDVSTDETPWCAAFANAMLENSGIAGTRSGLAQSFKNWGEKLSGPRMGAIVVFDRGGGLGHVGFVVGKTASGKVAVLGGNQSGSVSVAVINLPILGYRWPKGIAVSTEPLPTIDVKAANSVT